MLEKTIAVAMAIGIATSLAASSASAGWTETVGNNHVLIAKDVQLGLTGQARFQAPLGGAECQITSRVTLWSGVLNTTGRAETFVPHPTSETVNCKGLGGLAFCQLHNLTEQEPNWLIHTTKWQTIGAITKDAAQAQQEATFTTNFLAEEHLRAIVVTTAQLRSQMTGAFCPVKDIILPAGEVGGIPEEPTNTTNVQLNGALNARFETTNGVIDQEESLVQGTLQIEDPAQRGKYQF
jgi:hypothetical protein